MIYKYIYNNKLYQFSTDYVDGKLSIKSGVDSLDLQIEEDRFGVEPELTAKLADGGWRIGEVPVSYDPRTAAAGKKIGWRDGIHTLRCIFRYRP